MTPLETLTACVLEADRRKPSLRIDNRFLSCMELLELTLALAGADFQFIGKSSAMDGAAVKPVWFSPVNVDCTRLDGQIQQVLIDGLGMDACWHLPSATQFKVIANSTANELPAGDPRRGAANLTPYMIEHKDYRWHNPPIPQRSGVVVTLPPPKPPATGAASLPGRQEMRETCEWLDAYYVSREGLQRPEGLSKNGRPDWEGVGAWIFDVYLVARLAGLTVEQARAKVISEIRKAGPEWQSKHPGETP